LSNGNYVVSTPGWDMGAMTDVGASTWADGNGGRSGLISAGTSLIGSSAGDRVGGGATALTQGNYVVQSLSWQNGAAASAGAWTWVDGDVGLVGVVSAANSLVGTNANESSSSRVTALANGNYVVSASRWDAPAAIDAGAVIWADGNSGVSGIISPANALTGTQAEDFVGNRSFALAGGDFAVQSPQWNDGAINDVGAVTWSDGVAPIAGTVSSANSLIGGSIGDQVGNSGVVAFDDGNYAIHSQSWDDGAINSTGAVTLARGGQPLSGGINASNSVIGGLANEGFTLRFDYDPTREQLVVGRRRENIVSLFTLPSPDVFSDGFE
jgi:hypothetical protein